MSTLGTLVVFSRRQLSRLIFLRVLCSQTIHNMLENKARSMISRSQMFTYQQLHVFFAPHDNNKYRIRVFLLSLSVFQRRRKGRTALHAHPLAGKFVSEHTGTSYRLLNAGSAFYPYLIRLSVKEGVV